MTKIYYRELKLDECDKISEINPEQYIKNAWRDVDGKKMLVEIDYLETGWPDSYDRYRNELGFLSKYVLLNSIFVLDQLKKRLNSMIQ